MKTKWFVLLTILLFSLALGCASDDDDVAASDDDDNDDNDDDTAATDDDTDQPDDDFEQDGVLISGRQTDANGFVSFTVADQGTIGFYVKDETQSQAALADIHVFLVTKDTRAVVLALDEQGRYLPFLADVASLTQLAKAKADGGAVFGHDWLLGMSGAQYASPNDPLVVGALIPADLLRVMLDYFFQEQGTQTLATLTDAVTDLVKDTPAEKIVQFAVLANPETATEPVPVSLAVYDRSHTDYAGFLEAVYLARCYGDAARFELYLRDEPLLDSSPGEYYFILAAPLDASAPAETLSLRVNVVDAVDGQPLSGVRLTLAPVAAVGITGDDGVYDFADVALCGGADASQLYLRASHFGYYAAQFELFDVAIGVANTFTVELSPIAVGPEDPTWVSIPGGAFGMGCSGDDANCEDDESPNHTVTVSGFEMTATEITQRQYYRVVATNPAWYDDCVDCPVEFVTWREAKDFCAALGGRLSTEAEWEYAARAGTATRYYCGTDTSCLGTIAWDKYNAGSRTRPAAERSANPFGLYDMLGNVWELTADWYEAGYYDYSPAVDPQGPAGGTYNVKRGGSWYSGFDNSRVSNRFAGDVDGRYANLGFRCVR